MQGVYVDRRNLDLEEVDVIRNPQPIVHGTRRGGAEGAASETKKGRDSGRRGDLCIVVITLGKPLLAFDLIHVKSARTVDKAVLATWGDTQRIRVGHGIDVPLCLSFDSHSVVRVADLERAAENVRSVGGHPANLDSSSGNAVAIVESGVLIEVERLKGFRADDRIEQIVQTKHVLSTVGELRGTGSKVTGVGDSELGVERTRNGGRVERHVAIASDVFKPDVAPWRLRATGPGSARLSPAGRCKAPTEAREKSRNGRDSGAGFEAGVECREKGTHLMGELEESVKVWNQKSIQKNFSSR